MGLNNLLNTHHTDIIITHHSSCPQRRALFVVTMDTNVTTVSTDELTQEVHSRIKVLLPTDLRNENEVDAPLLQIGTPACKAKLPSAW